MTPAPLTPEQIKALAFVAGCTEDDDGAIVTRLVIATAAARDAQWQARLDAAIAAEQQRICAVIQAYPEWIGRTAKEDLCLAIMRAAG